MSIIVIFAEDVERLKFFLNPVLFAICNIWNTTVNLFFKHPALAVEVALNRNYSRYNSACFATAWWFKTLYKSSE
jgi:hypothetical protein